MIESSYFRRRKVEMKECYLKKWLMVGSVFCTLSSSNLSATPVVGDTTLIPIASMLATDTFLTSPLDKGRLRVKV
jgi:hypothetical protein